jgi:hypothetical protein
MRLSVPSSQRSGDGDAPAPSAGDITAMAPPSRFTRVAPVHPSIEPLTAEEWRAAMLSTIEQSIDA